MKTILVLLDSGLEPFRGVLKGIGGAYSQIEGLKWVFRHPASELDEMINDLCPSLVICSIDDNDQANFFRSLGIPVLNIHGKLLVPDLPSIEISTEGLAQSLAALVSQKGLEHLYWMDLSEKGVSQFNCLEESESIKNLGANFEIGFKMNDFVSKAPLSQKSLLIYGQDRQAMEYLEDNPEVLNLRVGLLGLGNDDIICHRTRPFLSSLALDGESCGHELVPLTDKMLAGLDVGLSPLELKVLNVVERESTSWMTSGDSRIKKAMSYFRNNMHLGHNVEELSRHTKMSYRTFHRLFSEETGLSPKSWMDREQFEKAKELLSQESDPLSKIASQCGYSDDKALIRAFRRLARKPPSAFRLIST